MGFIHAGSFDLVLRVAGNIFVETQGLEAQSGLERFRRAVLIHRSILVELSRNIIFFGEGVLGRLMCWA